MAVSPIKGSKAEAHPSSLLTPRKSAARDAFMLTAGLAAEVARARFSEILRAQPEQGFAFLPPTREGVPAAAVSKEELFVVGAKIAEGTYTRVNKVTGYSFVEAPQMPRLGQAIKVPKKNSDAFSQEYEILRHATGDQFGKAIGIDWILRSEQCNDSTTPPFALHRRYLADFWGIDYSALDFPATFLAPRFAQIASGLALIHRNGYIHRDIKPNNLLLSEENSRDSAALTDWGFLMQVQHAPHKTLATPEFIDPAMFDSLIDQKNKQGLQTKEGDVYALGRSLENILCEVCACMASKTTTRTKIFTQCDKIIKHKVFKGPLTDAELIGIDREHSGQAIYAIDGSVHVLVPLATLRNAFASLWDTYWRQGVFRKSEVDGLKRLTELALSMQEPKPAERPDAEGVMKELLTICHELGVEPAQFGFEGAGAAAAEPIKLVLRSNSLYIATDATAPPSSDATDTTRARKASDAFPEESARSQRARVMLSSQPVRS